MQSAVISKCGTVPVTKHGAQMSGAQRSQINTRLYTTYWSKGVAEYDGKKADVLRIDIHLLPIGTSADPPFTIVRDLLTVGKAVLFGYG